MGEVQLNVNLDSEVAAAEQFKRQIQQMVKHRLWRPGMRLPTVRQIALDTEINANVVSRLCRQLTEEGYMLKKEGTGTFGVGRAPGTSEQHSRVFNV